MAEMMQLRPEVKLRPEVEQSIDLVKARIPKRFWSVRLSTFERRTQSQGLAADAVEQWLERRADGPMLALVGETKTGKSHLLYSAAHVLYSVPRTSIYTRPWYALVDQLRYGEVVQTEVGGRVKEPAEVRADWWQAPVVLLDEVRPTSGTDFDALELAKFACHAYDQCRAVLITTNTPLVELLGAPAARRFTQVVMVGPGRAN